MLTSDFAKRAYAKVLPQPIVADALYVAHGGECSAAAEDAEGTATTLADEMRRVTHSV